jgi:hypothetical protein
MSMTPGRINDELSSVIIELEELADTIRILATEAAEADVRFKSAYAKHRLKCRAELSTIKPTEPYLADLADTATTDERLAHMIAQARLTASRDALRATQARLDGLRTMSAGIRAAGG